MSLGRPHLELLDLAMQRCFVLDIDDDGQAVAGLDVLGAIGVLQRIQGLLKLNAQPSG